MNPDFKSPFPKKLKKLRLEHGVSQKDLAKDLGISRSCLANYETGKRQPDNETLIRVADRFHVMVDYLLDRSGYEALPLSPATLVECVRIKCKFQNQLKEIDLSPLDAEGKLSVLQYYHHFDALYRSTLL